MESTWDGYFPPDVVNEILQWLPVKSLLRFKCVCKYWYALIQSHGFVRNHFNHENNRTRLLVYYTSDNCREGVSFLPDETLVGMLSSDNVIDYIQCPHIVEHLVGPIDGLFFLHNSDGFNTGGDAMTLWNPSTREFRPLPEPPPIISPYFYSLQTFGFGLDPLTCDYKVIWIRWLIDGRTDVPLPYLVVAVYSLGSDSWRYLDPLTLTLDNPCIRENSLAATCINGTYYWLLSYDDAQHSILAFDLSCEVFCRVDGPNHAEKTLGSLTLCNDSLALFLCHYGVFFQSIIEIFVMKEEGCWDKLATVKSLVEVSRPLGFWNKEEVLLESSSSELFSYNHDTHEITNLGKYGDDKKVFSYKESLLPVKGRNKDTNRCDFSDTLGDNITFSVPATRYKALVDKTEELAKSVRCFSREQELCDKRQRLGDEFMDVDGLPDEDLAEACQMIMDDTFFSLDGAHRNEYVKKLVWGGK